METNFFKDGQRIRLYIKSQMAREKSVRHYLDNDASRSCNNIIKKKLFFLIKLKIFTVYSPPGSSLTNTCNDLSKTNTYNASICPKPLNHRARTEFTGLSKTNNPKQQLLCRDTSFRSTNLIGPNLCFSTIMSPKIHTKKHLPKNISCTKPKHSQDTRLYRPITSILWLSAPNRPVV
jgi:hypothetical protein